MHNKRLVWFFIMIVVGLAGGLLYGWLVNPVKYVNTSAESLHPGFKADYVLMVAEIYQMDKDLPGAVQRLSLLGTLPAPRLVADGLLTARGAGYARADLDLMEALSKALQDAPAEAPASSATPPVGSTPETAITPTTGGQP